MTFMISLLSGNVFRSDTNQLTACYVLYSTYNNNPQNERGSWDWDRKWCSDSFSKTNNQEKILLVHCKCKGSKREEASKQKASLTGKY